MFDLIFNDIVGAVEAVINNSSAFLLVLFAIVGIAMGISMDRLPSIFGRAFQGLIALALIYFLYDVLSEPNRFTWDAWNNEGASGWQQVTGFTMLGLLGYYFWMAVLIVGVYLIKNVVRAAD